MRPRGPRRHVWKARTRPLCLITPCLIAASVALLSGCQQERAGQALALKEGLAAAEAAGRIQPLASADLATPEALFKVLGRRFHQLAPRLGGLTQGVETTFRIESEGRDEITLEGAVTLHIDDKGQFALAYQHTGWTREEGQRVSGRRCWWVADRYYTARTHGPATEVPIRAYEQDHCLDTAVEPFVALVELLGPHLAVSDRGPRTVSGRKALAVGLDLAGNGAEIPPDLPLAWPDQPEEGPEVKSPAIWGITTDGRPEARPPLVATWTRPLKIQGSIALDEATGAPVAGVLEARLLMKKAGRRATLHLTATLTSRTLERVPAAPEKARAYGARQRIFKDRTALLGEAFKGKKPKDQAAEALPRPGDAPALKPRSAKERKDEKREPARRAEDEDAPGGVDVEDLPR